MKTNHYQAVLDQEGCMAAYAYLRENISWEEGVRGRNGPTRLAKAVELDEDPVVHDLLMQALKLVGGDWAVFGVYLNYYATGEHYTPQHKHPGTVQLIVSLGGPRTLKLNNKDYTLANGDVIVFGGGSHGVPKVEVECAGRISIATFMVPA